MAFEIDAETMNDAIDSAEAVFIDKPCYVSYATEIEEEHERNG